jgi:hypothetical protein
MEGRFDLLHVRALPNECSRNVSDIASNSLHQYENKYMQQYCRISCRAHAYAYTSEVLYVRKALSSASKHHKVLPSSCCFTVTG